MPKNHPVKRVTKEQIARKGIGLDTFPAAGPYPNVTGMKRKYWGIDAFCIRGGTYVYKVTQEVYDLF